jgi:methylmalonyl-CoA mutase N-terminal domain/subunit
VLGGTQSLHVNSKDEALGLPTEESARLALRTQQVLAAESGVADTVDPLAGSYYVEHLTDRLEEQALALIERIDGMGGAVAAIEAGYQKDAIEEAAYAHLKLVESGERVIVGLNAYETPGEANVAPQATDPGAEPRQIERLRRVRSDRDHAAVEASLRRLEEAATTPGANTMPPIVECAEAYATLGEICDTLRGVFGEFKQPED